MEPRNLHGTALVLADRGVLIAGRSGAGKTTLALALIEAALARGRFARLIADDQLFVRSTAGGRLVAEAPAAIRGLVEIYGLGPRPVPVVDRAVIDLVVRLVDPGSAPRLQEDAAETIAGVQVPSISLAERNAGGAVFAIAARLCLRLASAELPSMRQNG